MKRFKFRIGAKEYNVEVEDLSGPMLVVMVNGRGYTVYREELSEISPSVSPSVGQDATVLPSWDRVNQRSDRVAEAAPSIAVPKSDLAAVPPLTEASAVPAGLELVRSPIPGKILSIAAKVGDPIRYGDALCILEAMKMESVIRAPVNGTLREIRIRPGDTVQYNDVLMVIHKMAD